MTPAPGDGSMKVIVGLGNPGSRYAGTRHNVGFEVVDRLAARAPAQVRFEALTAEIWEGAQKILLAKPQTFMNRSGRSVRQIVDYYEVPRAELLVICDDINLPLGRLRFRARGTHGGHNGLRDIQNQLGTTEYPRLRIGIDLPPPETPSEEYVLARFRPSERPIIEDACERAAQAVTLWIGQGIEACMNQYNG